MNIINFIKFLLPALLAVGLPLLGLIGNGYVFVNSFPYGGYIHSSVAIANFIFKLLLAIGLLGLIVGLANPKYAYFSKNPTRRNVVLYYSFFLVLSFISNRELIYLSKFTEDIKKPSLSDFFGEVVIGEKTGSLIAKIHNSKYQLQWWGGSSGSFNRISGFPYHNPAAKIIDIHFPGLAENSKIVVEISDYFDSINSQVIRSVLIENNRVVLSNPKIEPEEPRILRGSFEKINEKTIVFKACGESDIYEVDSSKLKEKFIFGFLSQPTFSKKFAIFSGSFLDKPICSSCGKSIKKVYIYDGMQSGNEKSYDCEFRF